jgi:hypothetical protein
MENPLDLLAERREILQALSHDEHALLVPDPHAEMQVAVLLAKAGELSDTHKRRELLEALTDLYDSYGPSIVRTLLDYAFLLYRAGDIDGIVKPLIDSVLDDATNDERLIDAFIHEIERYAASPYWPARTVIKYLIKGLVKKPGVAARLLSNEGLNFETALSVVDQVIEKRLKAEYSAIVGFVTYVCRGKAGNAVQERVVPLSRGVAKMGTSGLDLFAPVYGIGGLGRHGHIIIAAFGIEFCKWFIETPPRPSRRWVRAAFFACLNAGQQHKNKMLSILLNEWASTDGGIAELVRELMDDERDRYRRFLDTLGAETRADAEAFLGPYTPPQSAAQILRAAESPQRVWEDFAERVVTRRRDGEAAADVFAKGTDEVRARIQKWVDTRQKGRFVSGFFARLQSRGPFLRLPAPAQMQLLKSRHFKSHAVLTRVREILQARKQLDPAVFKRLLKIGERLGLRDIKADDRDGREVLR